MQTFLPYPNFIESAKCLDYRRLGKQRIEAKQILQINLIAGKEFVWIDENTGIIYTNSLDLNPHDLSHIVRIQKPEDFYSKQYRNHPAVLMWRGYEKSLAEYGINICAEWVSRGYKDNLMSFFMENGQDIGEAEKPFWFGNKEFHLSHQSNLVRKYSEHYRKYFPDVPNNLDYYWPIKKEAI